MYGLIKNAGRPRAWETKPEKLSMYVCTNSMQGHKVYEHCMMYVDILIKCQRFVL